MRISVDVGGTFTDVILLDEKTSRLRLEKVETTPQNPASGVLQGLEKIGAKLPEVDYFVHGTTLGANALLTRPAPGWPSSQPRVSGTYTSWAERTENPCTT